MSAVPSTAETSPPPAEAAAASAAQLKAGLWADAAAQVHAVVMGSRMPDLPGKLAAAGTDIADFDCLVPGALSEDVQRSAAYMVRLKPDSPFTDWLLFEAVKTLGEWGVLVRSPVRPMVLRNHLRGLQRALLPDGTEVAREWMDPPILLGLLPLFEPAELGAFFGPMQSLTVAGAASWRHAETVSGRLVQREIPLLRPT